MEQNLKGLAVAEEQVLTPPAPRLLLSLLLLLFLSLLCLSLLDLSQLCPKMLLECALPPRGLLLPPPDSAQS